MVVIFFFPVARDKTLGLLLARQVSWKPQSQRTAVLKIKHSSVIKCKDILVPFKLQNKNQKILCLCFLQLNHHVSTREDFLSVVGARQAWALACVSPVLLGDVTTCLCRQCRSWAQVQRYAMKSCHAAWVTAPRNTLGSLCVWFWINL